MKLISILFIISSIANASIEDFKRILNSHKKLVESRAPINAEQIARQAYPVVINRMLIAIEALEKINNAESREALRRIWE